MRIVSHGGGIYEERRGRAGRRRGRVAIRVDERGVVLARPTLSGRVPEPIGWPDVKSIVVFKRGMHAELGVVKHNAGIPATEFTPGRLALPDVSIRVLGWKLDLPALAAAAHAHAPDVRIFDERRLDAAPARGGRQPGAVRARKLRKRRIAGVGTLGVLFIALLVVLAVHSTSQDAVAVYPAHYTIEAGPAGQDPAIMPPPVSLGDRGMLFTDPAPVWQLYPSLLPTGPASAYATMSGYYGDAAEPDVSADAIYARERADGAHRGVFSIPPSQLAGLVDSAMLVDDPSAFDTDQRGATGGKAVLECGTYVGDPLCVWADDSMLVVAQYPNGGGSLQGLVSEMPMIVQGMAGDDE